MKMDKVLFSSNKEEWETPQELFDRLNNEFHFDLDVCALPENSKCKKYYTPSDDGLRQPWIGCVWCNPPYGRKIGSWIKKAHEEHEKRGSTIVMILPARTDTRWFHEFIYNKQEIRFIKGRLKFGNSKNSAPFPSMIVVFEKKEKKDGQNESVQEIY